MPRRGGSIGCGRGEAGQSRGRGNAPPGGNRSDAERQRLVLSDAGRKRGAHKWTNLGRTPPHKFFCRDVEEYDRRFEAGSSSGAGSSSVARTAPLPPPKREEEEEERDHPPGAGLLPGDFADEDSLSWITGEVMKRSKLEEENRAAWRRLEEELKNLCYEQGLTTSR